MRAVIQYSRYAIALTLAVFLTVLGSQGAAAQVLVPLEGSIASLDRTTVPAAGRHQSVLEVERFGRYSVTVKSEQGVALQLIDRMAGPGPIEGIPGEENGRLDVFLDRGEYLIRTHGHDASRGEAVLAVHAFSEIHPEPAPQLVEFKPLAATLGDFEQRSYWLKIDKRRHIDIEAAGRTLRDLRIWLEGSWLVDAVPEVEVLEPRVGRPLPSCRLATQLEPGFYLVTAYGGRPEPWADDDGSEPFHLRMGIPTRGTAGRARFEVSPFGVDRFRVPAAANFFRLELPEARPAALRVGRFSEATPFAPIRTSREIDKESRVPAVEIDDSRGGKGYDIVTVKAEAGQSYVLQHFEVKYHHRFGGTGDYWISTIHSGHPTDAVDATAFLAHWPPSGSVDRRPLREQTVVVGQDRGWTTRSNLIEPLTIFVRIKESGTYVIESAGTEAEFRFEPFFVHRPRNYEAPRFRPAGEWDLEANFYVLTARPSLKGILEMAVKPAAMTESLLGRMGTVDPVRASVRFPSVGLVHRHRYEVFLNRQPEVKAGLVLRPLPLSLDDPLPLTLRPGEEVTIPFKATEASQIEAVAEDGTRLALALADGEWQPSPVQIAAGHQWVRVRHDGDVTVVLSVAVTPLRLLRTAPLPPLPAGALDALPDFEVLAAGDPRFFDLDRNEHRVFLVRPEDDALYRLESTGLLDTEGRVRSRVVTALASSGSGGGGRNFFLHQYLNAGDYQLDLNPRGRSKGHLGLELVRTDPIDGGELRSGLPARIALDEGESVVYRFHIEEPGRYRLRSFGLGYTPRARLEDAERWPLETPNVPANFDRHFDAGGFRLILLPESVAGRRVTLLEKVTEPPSFSGHGPHRLPLDTAVEHRWLESPEGEERVQDRWLFELSGSTEVSIRLTNNMQGRIFDVDDNEVAIVLPNRGYRDRLETGSYRLDVECARRDNRVDYEIEIRPTALLAGSERQVQAPTRIPVAVGAGGLLELTSFGEGDVEAGLEDERGRLVAKNDDRPGDWNFHLAARLEPGDYTLYVSPVGSGSATTTVSLEAREQVVHEPFTVELASHWWVARNRQESPWTSLEPGTAVHLFPLVLPEAEVLLASVRASESLGLALERQAEDGSWETLAQRTGSDARLEVPIAGERGKRPHRLRLWSADRRGHPVDFALIAVAPAHVGERELAAGVSLRSVALFEADRGGKTLAVAAVELDRPGTIVFRGPQEIRWAGADHAALEPVRGGYLPVTEGTGWIVIEADDEIVHIAVERLVLGDDEVQLPVTFDRPLRVDLGGRVPSGPRLILARSMVGQPAVRLAGAPAIARQAAASVALGGETSARVWLAEAADLPIDVRLEARAYAPRSAESAGYGRVHGDLEDGSRAFELPPGEKRLHLVLTPGIVAAVARGDEVLSVHWNGGTSLMERFVTDGDRLLLLHTEGTSERFTFEALPADGDHILATGSPLELLAPAAGTLRLQVAPGADERSVHIHGTDEAWFLGTDDKVRRGRRIPVGTGGGTLVLPHDPGLVLAWIALSESGTLSSPPLNPPGGTLSPSGDPGGKTLWTGIDVPAPVPLKAPARIRLDRPVVAFALESDEPVLLSLAGEGRALYRLTTPKGSRSWLDTTGGVEHALLPAGRSELAVRAVAERTLGHDLEILTVPVIAVGEGQGPEVLLAPGGAHAFRFTVTEPGSVGMGVRADSDAVECELMTPDGRKLGRGVVQMHELGPGDYLLVVRLAASAEAVTARPAVVGLDQPGTGPPESEIRRYVGQ